MVWHVHIIYLKFRHGEAISNEENGNSMWIFKSMLSICINDYDGISTATMEYDVYCKRYAVVECSNSAMPLTIRFLSAEGKHK